jgi:hypothetical protein
LASAAAGSETEKQKQKKKDQNQKQNYLERRNLGRWKLGHLTDNITAVAPPVDFFPAPLFQQKTFCLFSPLSQLEFSLM